MKKLGEYEWRQVSLWEFVPKSCIQKFVESSCGKHTFEFYLIRCSEVISETHIKTETVTRLLGVPEQVLAWRGSDYRLLVKDKNAE